MTDIDELLDTIGKMKSKQKMTNDLYEDQIKQLSAQLEKELLKGGLDCAATQHTVAFYRKETKVNVEDWNEVLQFVSDHDAFDILQRRISPAAFKRRVEAGSDIPGATIKEGKVFIVQGKKEKKDETDSQ